MQTPPYNLDEVVIDSFAIKDVRFPVSSNFLTLLNSL